MLTLPVQWMRLLRSSVAFAASIRKEAGAPLKTKVDILVKLTDPALKPIFEQNFDFIGRFVNSKAFTVGTDVAEPKMAGSAVITGATIFVPLNELIDLDEEKGQTD